MAAVVGKISFHVADYVVFTLTLAISLAIGIYFACSGGRQRTPEEYLLGNRKLHVIPVTLSLVASFMSAITVLGVPAEIYFHGIQYVLYPVGIIAPSVFLALVFVPTLYPLRLTSIFQYLQLRYQSPAAKLAGSVTNILSEVSYAGVAIFAPAIALETVTDIPVWASMVIMVLLCTVYTAMGGIKAVVWADAFQTVIMVGTLICVVVLGILRVGGVSEVATRLGATGRLRLNFDPDPTRRDAVWNYLVGHGAQFLFVTSGQTAGQRFCSLPSLKQAKLLYLLALPGFCIIMILSAAAGAVAFAYYDKTGCDPKAAGYISNSNQIMPYFVADVIGYPGLSGLFIAGIFAAVVSTVSSIQNSLSAIVWEDYMKTKFSDLSQWRQTMILKAIVVVVGVFTLALGFLAAKFSGTLIQVFAVAGSFQGARFAMFLIGGATSFVGGTACILGASTGVAVSVTFVILNLMNAPDWPGLPTKVDTCPVYNMSRNATAGWLPSTEEFQTLFTTLPVNDTFFIAEPQPRALSSYYFGLVSCLVTVIVALLLSAIPAFRTKNKVHPEYLFPWLRRSRSSNQHHELVLLRQSTDMDS